MYCYLLIYIVNKLYVCIVFQCISMSHSSPNVQRVRSIRGIEISRKLIMCVRVCTCKFYVNGDCYKMRMRSASSESSAIVTIVKTQIKTILTQYVAARRKTAQRTSTK